MLFAWPRQLRQQGVLGINERNCRYVADCNPRRLLPLVNDKLRTKRIADAAGVAAPRLYGTIEILAQIRRLEEILAGHEDFVVKPALGAQGNGIVVIEKRMRDGWRRLGGLRMTDRELAFHLANVLSGMYSLNGLTDVAMLEERVRFTSLFDAIAYQGVPDIRLLVYKGVPCMAMVRLPTRESDGKANIHKGALGVGIAIASGRTTHAVHHNRLVDEHPDTGNPVRDIQLPDWHEILRMASRCYDQIGLGYLGVDLVIDRTRGPLLLELNARPGLSVQLANHRGLCSRLEEVDRRGARLRTAEERVDFAVQAFDGAPASGA